MHVDKNYFWGHKFLNIHIISKPLDLDQMRMGQIKNNSVGIKNSNRGNIQQAIKNFLQHLFIRLFIRFIYYHYLENTKQLKNEIKQQKKKKKKKNKDLSYKCWNYSVSHIIPSIWFWTSQACAKCQPQAFKNFKKLAIFKIDK